MVDGNALSKDGDNGRIRVTTAAMPKEDALCDGRCLMITSIVGSPSAGRCHESVPLPPEVLDINCNGRSQGYYVVVEAESIFVSFCGTFRRENLIATGAKRNVQGLA